jgi:tRNA(Arg) A34 adenosine deaminase TadA/beta-phosphoglucomutase-like phosphatase (HAD superfamily)
MLAGILIGLEDTLLDAAALEDEAWDDVFRREGYRVGRARLHEARQTEPTRLVAAVLGADVERSSGQALRRAQDEAFRSKVERDGLRPRPAAAALLRELHRRGLSLGLLSRRSHASTTWLLARVGLDPAAFSVIVAPEGERVRSARGALLEACERLGFAPSATALVTTTRDEVRAAREVGISVVGVGASDEAAGKRLRREGARLVYPDADSLLAVVDDALEVLSPGPLVLTWSVLDRLLDAALSFAREGLERGGVPIGCVVADERGEILAGAHNGTSLGGDAVAHAELQAFRKLGAALDSAVPATTRTKLLASSLEPCVMCTGAMMEIGLDCVVYAQAAPADGGVRRVLPPSSPENQTPRFVGPRRADESRRLFETFLVRYPDHPSAAFVRSLLAAHAD